LVNAPLTVEIPGAHTTFAIRVRQWVARAERSTLIRAPHASTLRSTNSLRLDLRPEEGGHSLPWEGLRVRFNDLFTPCFEERHVFFAHVGSMSAVVQLMPVERNADGCQFTGSLLERYS